MSFGKAPANLPKWTWLTLISVNCSAKKVFTNFSQGCKTLKNEFQVVVAFFLILTGAYGITWATK